MSEAGDAPTISHKDSVSRRSFLGVLLGFGTVVMGAALSVPLIRFALHPLLTKTTDIGWSDVGKIDEFASLTAPLKKLITVEQRDGWRKIVSEKAIYVLPMNNVNVFASINNHRFVGVLPGKPLTRAFYFPAPDWRNFSISLA